jgi:thioredoxin 1
MKSIASIIIGLSVFGILYSFTHPKVGFNKETPGGIAFHQGTWKEALAKAKKENKLIFLEVYATWCGPCKRLKANTFSNQEVGAYFNSHFINVAMDAEKGEGIQIEEKYQIQEYPTMLFINANGKIVQQTAGYKSPNELIAWGKTIKKGK